MQCFDNERIRAETMHVCWDRYIVMTNYVRYNITHNQYGSLCCVIVQLRKCLKNFVESSCVPLFGEEISKYMDGVFARNSQNFQQCPDKFNSVDACATSLSKEVMWMIENVAHQERVPRQNESIFLITLDMFASFSWIKCVRGISCDWIWLSLICICVTVVNCW